MKLFHKEFSISAFKHPVQIRAMLSMPTYCLVQKFCLSIIHSITKFTTLQKRLFPKLCRTTSVHNFLGALYIELHIGMISDHFGRKFITPIQQEGPFILISCILHSEMYVTRYLYNYNVYIQITTNNYYCLQLTGLYR